MVSSALDGWFMSLRLCAARLGTWWLCFALGPESQGSLLWQTNAKCISVNSKISGVIVSCSLKRKSNLHSINGHRLISLFLPSTCYSCSQKLCKSRFRQCSRQQCSKYHRAYKQTGTDAFFVVVCGRRQQQRNVGFVRGWPRRCRVAVAISSTSMQGSALLFLTGPQSRDCVRNWKAGDAAKKSECFICEEPTSKAA